MDSIELSLFVSRIQAICREMGAVLQYSALSPNIRDRLDFSCAVFDAEGGLCSQAAHIPVHLGSMAYAMQQVIHHVQWEPGDVLIFNDPFLGGTHLPDITLLAPVFHNGRVCAFTANRAHHADIGSPVPGSMPLTTSIHEEGVLIRPGNLYRNHVFNREAVADLLGRVHDPGLTRADLSAQASSVNRGVSLLGKLVQTYGDKGFESMVRELNGYAARLARDSISRIPPGHYSYTDFMDDDGMGQTSIPLHVDIEIGGGEAVIDFSRTPDQVAGNINCPLPVTAAAVNYVFYSLMPPQTPACAGSFSPLHIKARPGSLVNAVYPAAVTAGNVETSTRLVDLVLGAMSAALPDRIPAASQGSMNNIAMGSDSWDYYETLGGGTGAGPAGRGLDAVQSHMTNTLNTPIEVVEMKYPLRVLRYAVNTGTGGTGQRCGGDGLTREYQFLDACTVTLLTERRIYAPWGLHGGSPGSSGENRFNDRKVGGKTTMQANAGDTLSVSTPGGGGWGEGSAAGG